jgi:putative endonuclease
MPMHVYMMASRRHGTIYIGVTGDLSRRVYEHKTKAYRGFTAKYDVDRLIWYEEHDDPSEAIAREKALKKWRRDWKIRLIEDFNPLWTDLYETLAN